MNKRSLIRIATSICFMVCVMILGQISAFADEIKPVHEYTFDNDPPYKVLDTGSNPVNGSSFGNADIFNQYRTGYNEVGKSYYFEGQSRTQMHFVSMMMPLGAQSIRFKFKKDASTVTEKSEPIITPYNSTDHILYIEIIGKGEKNQDNTINELVPGCLRILQPNDTINFELHTPKNICDGQWHDILYTWDGTTNTNSVKLYVDDMTTPVSQTTANSIDKGTKRNIFIGVTKNYNTDKSLGYLKGYLDNIQIYDSVFMPKSDTSSNLKAIGGNSKIDLTWNAVTDATSYTIKRSTTAGGPYTAIKTGVTGTTYTDADVTNGTTYYYVVTAIVNGGEG